MRISDWRSVLCSSDLTRAGLSQDRDVAAASLAEAEVRAGNDAADAKLVAEPLLDKRVRRECGDRSVKRDCHRVVGAELPEKPVPLDKARKEKRLCRRIEVDRKSTRLNSSHSCATGMPSSA